RETQLQELESSLEQLSREIGQPRLRSDKAVQRRVNARVRNSSAGQFLSVTVNTTTRRLIQRLEPLTIIETPCWDGSSLRRLPPDDPDLLMLLERVADALDDLVKAVIPANQPKALPGATATSPTHLLPDGMRC
ncbi:MAG: hypothetical protein ACKO4U_08755, partial [Caldilinea sp.]